MPFVQIARCRTMRSYIAAGLDSLDEEVRWQTWGELRMTKEITLTLEDGEQIEFMAQVHAMESFEEIVLPTRDFIEKLKALEEGDRINYFRSDNIVKIFVDKGLIPLYPSDVPSLERKETLNLEEPVIEKEEIDLSIPF